MTLPDVAGWVREEAEAALLAAGAREITIMRTEPVRGSATGRERVVGQRRNGEEIVLIVAREMTREDVARKDDTA